ncbi:MAG TPA: PhnD/SsuA/transferrin family substrate-binding protein [Anaeromyxobacteraceae bacterium]|nr:PhnD/SsuA/transferrin family substrate-binding protein [Anaeromyxobacteraceae bacterium]
MDPRRRQAAGIALAFLVTLGCEATPYEEVRVDFRVPPPAVEWSAAPPTGRALRLSVAAMQSPVDTFSDYSRFLERMGTLLGERVRFVQRRTYAEVNDLLLSGQLDAALLCTGGFLDLEARNPGAVEVLAVPVIDGRTTYRSLVLVPEASRTRSLWNLAGMRFAFTDELSLSGHLYVARLLADSGREPGRFFASTVFTRSHDRSVDAVARGVVDGAAVDSLVFDALAARDPSLRSRVRVVHRSPPYGVMPVVASTTLPAETRARLRAVLLGLHQDPEAAEALRAVHIERFVPPEPGLYDEAARVARRR